MSIKTTHFCTREFAIKVIKMKLDEVDDNQIANILEEVIHNGFYNFVVVDSFALEQDKKAGMPILDDLNNIPEYNDAW